MPPTPDPAICEPAGSVRVPAEGTAPPLCVEPIGTLLRSDPLLETLVLLIRRNPLSLLLLPWWLLRGRAHLQHRIAERIRLDAGLLAYDERVLTQLRTAHRSGRRIVLVTKACAKVADAIASHLGIVEAVLASDDKTLLEGRDKLAAVETHLHYRPFDYMGASPADAPLFRRARSAYLFGPTRRLAEVVGTEKSSANITIEYRGVSFRAVVAALRLHQWTKNLLLFVPLVTAHQYTDPVLVLQAFVAFLAFGLCASAIYLFNDLLDLPDDRRHPTKRRRPFAAGTLPLQHGLTLLPVLLATGFLLAADLPAAFGLALLLYCGIALLYSLRIKRVAVADVLTLALLYATRVVAGAAAISVTASPWLLAFSAFFFLSLALAKRYTELGLLRNPNDASFGRGYRPTDADTLGRLGMVSGLAATAILILYAGAESVRERFSHPDLLFGTCLFLLLIGARIWLHARAGTLDDDPVLFVLRDRVSRWLSVAGALLFYAAV